MLCYTVVIYNSSQPSLVFFCGNVVETYEYRVNIINGSFLVLFLNILLLITDYSNMPVCSRRVLTASRGGLYSFAVFVFILGQLHWLKNTDCINTIRGGRD